MKGAECWSHSSKQPQQEEVTGRYVQPEIVTHTHVVTHTTPHNQLPRLTLSHPHNLTGVESHTHIYTNTATHNHT